jgi:threonine dehydratase
MTEHRRGFRPTILYEHSRLSTRLGARVTIASEVCQPTGSFKIRAALHVVSHVSQNLLIASSAGNFGQSLAYACLQVRKSCIIAMPKKSARVKIEAVREYGGQVDLYDTAIQSGDDRVRELIQEHPEAYRADAFDDPLVIEGLASLGIELAKVTPSFDFVLIPIAGGGLSAGIIQGIRQEGAKITAIGAEPAVGNDAALSLKAGHIVKLDKEPQTNADGARTRSLGVHTWPIIKDGMTDIVEVSEDQIREAVRLLFTLANTKAEPAGALAVGAMLSRPSAFKGSNVCCVVSGGNVDPAVYADILLGS